MQVALHLRTCTARLPITPRPNARACLLKDLGACSAPCVKGVDSGYDAVAASARAALTVDPGPVVSAIERAIEEHAEALNFERAAELRDGISAVVEGAFRSQRLESLRRCSIVAVRRVGDGWDLAATRGGSLVGTERVTAGVWAAADRLLASSQTLDVPAEVLVEEQEMIASWLERDGTRLLYVDGEWSMPVVGAGPHHRWITARTADRASVAGTTRG